MLDFYKSLRGTGAKKRKDLNMALTRKMLEALNVDEKAIEQIIEAHTETVNGLKEKITNLQDKADKYDEAQKELASLQKGDYKAKYEKEHKDFEAYKSEVTEKETKAAKERAAKAYFEGKNITGKNLEIAMRGASGEVSALELDANGNIKDSKALDDLVSGTFSGLVVKSEKQGAKTATPPSGSSGAPVLSKQDIMKIKDTTERQKAWAKYLSEGNKTNG